MIRNSALATDCRRDFDTVSTRYQNRVRNLKPQTADAHLIPYQNGVRSNSYISKIEDQSDGRSFDRQHRPGSVRNHNLRTPRRAPRAPATGALPDQGRRIGP